MTCQVDDMKTWNAQQRSIYQRAHQLITNKYHFILDDTHNRTEVVTGNSGDMFISKYMEPATYSRYEENASHLFYYRTLNWSGFSQRSMDEEEV
jgi:hypothetical protein